MAIQITNVNIVTDSFQNWVDKTNTLLYSYSTYSVTAAPNTAGSLTTGNAIVNGTFVSNNIVVNGTVNAGLRGGNLTTSNVLYIVSNVSIGNSSVNTSISNAGINTISIVATGNATIGGLASITGNATLSGSLQTISGNVNVDSGTLFVDATNNRVGINNTAPGVALHVTGQANITGNTTIGGVLNVTGNTSFTGNTDYTGAVVFSNTVAVTGNVNLSNTLTVTGNVNLSNTLTVTGNVTISNTANIVGAVALANTLAVAGNVSITGTGLHTVAGNVNFDSGTVLVDATNNRLGVNTASPSVALEVTGDTKITGVANVTANLQVGGDIIIAGNVVVSGSIGGGSSGVSSGGAAQTFNGNTTTVLIGNSTANGYILMGAKTSSFSNNDLVTYIANTGNTAIGGLANGTNYYVLTTNSTAIQLVNTVSNAAINLTSVPTSSQPGHFLVNPGAQVRGTLAAAANTILLNLQVNRLATFANTVNAESMTTRGFTQTGAGTFDVSGTAINFRNGQVFFNGGLKSLGDFEVTSGATAVTLAPAITANSSLTVNGAVSFNNKTLVSKSTAYITFNGNSSSVLVGNSTVNGFIAVDTSTLVNNDIVTYLVASLNQAIGGLANNTDYYVKTTNSTHIQLSATPGGPAIYLTSVASTPQSGHYFAPKLYNVRGSLAITGNTTVGGYFIATGNTTLSNTLIVSGATAFGNTLGATGAATFSNTLSATGAVTFSNTLSVTNTVTFSNTLLVTGAVTMSNNLTVSGTVTFNQPVNFAGGTGAQSTDITTSANLNANQIVVATGNIIANSTTLKIGNNTSGVITVGNTSFKTNTAISVNKTYAETTNSYGTSVNTLYNNVTLTGYAQHYANYTYAVANTLSANSTGGNPGNDLYGTVTIAKNANTEMGTENSRLSTLGAGFFEARNAAGGTTANTLTNAIGVYAVARSWGKGIITSATGVNSAVLVGNSTVTGNITTAYGVSSVVESNALGTIATGYLYYGSHNGSNTTNKFGIYLQGESNNYLSGMLNVVGNTVLGNNVTLGGNITVSGTSHTLSGNVNIDAGTFYVDAVNNRVGVNNTAPTLALQVTGAANVSGNATVGSILTVSGNAAITGNTTVTGLTTLSGNATLSGALQTIAGNVNIDSGTLFVDSVNNRVGINNTAPTVSLQVTGTSNVTGAAAFANTINVTGAATLANTLLVTGAATFSNTISVAGAITFSGALGAGNTTITGYANATGNLNANGLNIALGNITANATTLIVGNTISGAIGVGNSTPSTFGISVNKRYTTDNDWGGNWNIVHNSNVAHAAARYVVGGYDQAFNNSQNRTSAGANLNSAHYASIGQFYNSNTVGANARTHTAFGGYFSTYNQAGGAAANTIDIAHGTISIVGTNSTGIINVAYGAKTLIVGSSTGNIGNSFGVHSTIDPGASATFANGVLLYGAFSNNATRVTSKWGLVVEGESFNKMSGALQVIGAVNTSTSFTVGAISTTNGASMNTSSIMLGNNTVNTVITATSSKIHTYHVANATGMYSSGLANATVFQSSNATHTGSIGFASGVRLGTTTVNSSMTDVLINIANSTVSTSIAKEYILATNANTSVKSISVGGATLGGVGEIRATNNITAFAASDQQFKENVEEIKDAVTIVSQIGGKTFDWTDDYINAHGGEDGYFVVKKDFGVIAQDVKKAFPLAVRTRADGTLAVDYEKLSALAFAAIIELKQEIEELKNGNKG